MRQVPQQALEIIKKFEGLKLKAYKDFGDKLTIGFGHTGKDVYECLEITKDQAEILLLNDAQKACNDVLSLVNVPLTDNELAALTSFCFNVGADIDTDDIAEGLGDSTLLKLLNAGHYDAVPAQLMRWRYCRGVELGGLVKRRRAEAALWNMRDDPLTC